MPLRVVAASPRLVGKVLAKGLVRLLRPPIRALPAGTLFRRVSRISVDGSCRGVEKTPGVVAVRSVDEALAERDRLAGRLVVLAVGVAMVLLVRERLLLLRRLHGARLTPDPAGKGGTAHSRLPGNRTYRQSAGGGYGRNTTSKSARSAKAAAFVTCPSYGPSLHTRQPSSTTSCSPCSGSQETSHSNEM